MIQRSRGRTRSPRRQIAQLTVTLLKTEPSVWRRILVPYDIPLRLLHRVLMVAMGWEGLPPTRFRGRRGAIRRTGQRLPR